MISQNLFPLPYYEDADHGPEGSFWLYKQWRQEEEAELSSFQ